MVVRAATREGMVSRAKAAVVTSAFANKEEATHLCFILCLSAQINAYETTATVAKKTRFSDVILY